MFKKLLMALTLIVWSYASAFGVTLTGTELFNHPNVSFPTTQPTLSGSSLTFGPGGSPNEKLFVLPLFPAGTFSSTGPATTAFSLNITRLACTSNPVCAGNQDDFDPHILVGDGTNIVGAVIADNGGGQFLGTTLTDAGNTGANRTLTDIFSGAGYPAIGNSFDVNVAFTLLGVSTTVDASFLGGTGNFVSTSTVLHPAAALSLIFMRDNDVGEQYQVNSLTGDDIAVIPIPAAGWLFLSALGGLFGLIGWRHRRTVAQD